MRVPAWQEWEFLPLTGMRVPGNEGGLMRKRRKNEGGAAALEFALVMPLLFLLLFGIIAFGVVFAQNLALSNAAREAARFGSSAQVLQDQPLSPPEQCANIAGGSSGAPVGDRTRSCGGGRCRRGRCPR